MAPHSRLTLAARLAAALVIACISISSPAALAQGKKGQKGDGQAKTTSQAPLDPALMVPFIDTHAHLDYQRLGSIDASVTAMIATMDALKIEKSIIMPTPLGGIPGQKGYDYPVFLPALQRFPDRVMLMAGPGTLGAAYFQKDASTINDADRQDFRAKAEMWARGPIAGFGEIGIVHLSMPFMGDTHPYEAAPADHPLLLELADVAAENGLAIDVHFDMVSRDMDLPRIFVNPTAQYPNPPRLVRNQEPFERFLAHNRGAKIVWAHVGGESLGARTPAVVRGFFARHPNLYMSIRLGRTSSSDEAMAFSPDGKLKPAWKAVIVEFPDRFVLGSDTFHQDGASLRGGSREGHENFHRLLSQLPPDVAAKIARDNVAHIYRTQVPALPDAEANPDGALPKGFAKKGKGKKGGEP